MCPGLLLIRACHGIFIIVMQENSATSHELSCKKKKLHKNMKLDFMKIVVRPDDKLG